MPPTTHKRRAKREEAALHPTVRSMLMAAQLAEKRREEEEDGEKKKSDTDAAAQKLNRHVGYDCDMDFSTAGEERESRRALRHRGYTSDGYDELEDWLAQADRERWSWNSWGAPEAYPSQVATRLDDREEKSRIGDGGGGGGGQDGTQCHKTWMGARDVWSAASCDRRASVEANLRELLFCPDTRFSCFVRIALRA